MVDGIYCDYIQRNDISDEVSAVTQSLSRQGGESRHRSRGERRRRGLATERLRFPRAESAPRLPTTSVEPCTSIASRLTPLAPVAIPARQLLFARLSGYCPSRSLQCLSAAVRSVVGSGEEFVHGPDHDGEGDHDLGLLLCLPTSGQLRLDEARRLEQTVGTAEVKAMRGWQ